MDLRPAAISDDVKDTLSYARVAEIARQVVELGKTRSLVETLANDIACRVLEESIQATEVTVSVLKPHVAVPNVDALGVEIVRTRDG